jgi:argininosuccinate lyase
MKDTGRLKSELQAEAARLAYPARESNQRQREQFWLSTEIDRAHIVMLAEAEIVDPRDAAAVLEAIERARASNFESVIERPTPRGPYMAWEDHLIETIGRPGEILQTGRSRNDLNATISLLSLRPTWEQGGDAIARAALSCARGADRWRAAAMPGYTNGQPAVPIVFGHWLAACGIALGRDLAEWSSRSSAMEECPLGAGATGGTTLPINAARTATLLGFERPLLNSVDAVACRDAHLRLASTAVGTTATLARASRSLAQWTSPELGFLRLPDNLSGASSNLPQKRNPFLLECVIATHAVALGAYVAGTTAASSAPFGNAISVNTEAIAALAPGFEALLRGAGLSSIVCDALEVDLERMEEASVNGFITASALSEKVVDRTDATFREAHHFVGELVGELEGNGKTLADCVGAEIAPNVLIEADDVSPAAVAAAVQSAGGPNARSLDACIGQIEARVSEWEQTASVARRGWDGAAVDLNAAVASIRGLGGGR